MDWKTLIKLQEFTPLQQLDAKYQHYDDDMLRIEQTIYVRASSYNPTANSIHRGPFINAVIWACSDGAFLRMARQKIEEDDNAIILPPKELLPSENAITFGLIYEGLKQIRKKEPLESAEYRITDGKFVHRVIDSYYASYYFRGRKNNDIEMPYAILWNMKMRD